MTRFTATACLLSGMAAVLRFEETTLTGRILAISSVHLGTIAETV